MLKYYYIWKWSFYLSFKAYLISASSLNKLHLLVCFSYLVNSSSFHCNKPGCLSSVDTLEVPQQIQAALAKALRHLSKLSVHISCQIMLAKRLLNTMSRESHYSPTMTISDVTCFKASIWLIRKFRKHGVCVCLCLLTDSPSFIFPLSV